MSELKVEDLQHLENLSTASLGSIGRLKRNSLYEVGECQLTVAHGSIVEFEGDAIVNATTQELVANVSDKEDFVGIGATADIYKACGEKLQEAVLEIKEVSPDCRCPTGEARITSAFNLKTVKYIIHTVGPRHNKYDKAKAKELLVNCYESCLNLAKEHKLETIAFPLISTGLKGYPLKEAITVALNTVIALEKSEYPKEVYFIMKSKDKYDNFEKLANEQFEPEKTKAASINPFITKGSTFRMSKARKVMLGLSSSRMVQEEDIEELSEESDEKEELFDDQ